MHWDFDVFQYVCDCSGVIKCKTTFASSDKIEMFCEKCYKEYKDVDRWYPLLAKYSNDDGMDDWNVYCNKFSRREIKLIIDRLEKNG